MGKINVTHKDSTSEAWWALDLAKTSHNKMTELPAACPVFWIHMLTTSAVIMELV